MYHVIGTGLTSSLLYLLSYLFCRLGFYSSSFHRKIWNLILAAAFILTAAAGLFMALQITYKWDLPYVKTILKWHVEFGIGMTFSGVFHMFWHLSYFSRIFERQRSTASAGDTFIPTNYNAGLNLFITGVVSSSLQLLLLREMLNIAGGYELIAGIFLGAWLIGSSFGALLSRNSVIEDVRKLNTVFALSPIISLFLMFFLARIFLHPGETPGLLVSLIYTFLVLIPFCLVSGYTFVRLLSIAGRAKNYSPGKSFSIETIGGVAAGVIISFLTSGILNTYQLIFLIILLALSYTILTYFIRGKKMKFAARVIILSVASTIILSSPDKIFRQLLLNGVRVTESVDTPYGNITHAEYNGEKSIYYNQRLLSYKADVTEREEDIHYAMLQSGDPEKVILISGSLPSRLPEILKYNVKHVTFIERDPELTREWSKPSDSSGINLSVVSSDAIWYLRKQVRNADVIISSLPPPATFQINRYFTTEFFQQVSVSLRAGGIFMCSPGPGEDYFNKESVQLLSSVYSSLRSVFRYVLPVSGNKLYFVASDSALAPNYCELTTKKKIKNIYVGPDYLSDDLIEKKSIEVASLLDGSARENRFGFPAASFHYLSLNFAKKPGEKIPAVILLILLFATPVLFVRRGHIMMYFSASALAGFEIAMLVTLQMIIGNMYQLTGLVIAALMAGLAAGSQNPGLLRLKPGKRLPVLVAFYSLAALAYNLVPEIKQMVPAIILIVVSTFLPALITGQLFNDLTVAGPDPDGAGQVYSADMAGSALGFLATSAVVIPLLGIRTSILISALMILAGFLFGTIRNKY
jgi:spermidine synthase